MTVLACSHAQTSALQDMLHSLILLLVHADDHVWRVTTVQDNIVKLRHTQWLIGLLVM